MQECVSEFISFITSEASERCQVLWDSQRMCRVQMSAISWVIWDAFSTQICRNGVIFFFVYIYPHRVKEGMLRNLKSNTNAILYFLFFWLCLKDTYIPNTLYSFIFRKLETKELDPFFFMKMPPNLLEWFTIIFVGRLRRGRPSMARTFCSPCRPWALTTTLNHWKSTSRNTGA